MSTAVAALTTGGFDAVAERTPEAVAPAPSSRPDWNDAIERIAAQDPKALAALYDASSRLVYSLAVRLLRDEQDAEEVTLEVFSQVWRSARDFDPRRGSARAWLLVLARSRALDRLRQRASRRRFEVEPAEDLPEPADPARNPEESAALAELQLRVRRALATLPAPQRGAIRLAYSSGLTHAELARVLGEPLGTVKTRIREGLIELRHQLEAPGTAAR